VRITQQVISRYCATQNTFDISLKYRGLERYKLNATRSPVAGEKDFATGVAFSLDTLEVKIKQTEKAG